MAPSLWRIPEAVQHLHLYLEFFQGCQPRSSLLQQHFLKFSLLLLSSQYPLDPASSPELTRTADSQLLKLTEPGPRRD